MRAPSLGFTLFELACALVIVATLAAMARARCLGGLLRDYAALAVAAFLGEESCIELYGFYSYAPAWHLRLHHVPLLVPLIWPLVVLSARDVVRALFPALRRGSLAAAVMVAVWFDAGLVEVLSVRAGFWVWAEPGVLGVPLVGISGWGFFALGAVAGLERRHPAAAALGLALVSTHVLLLGSWWALFRWAQRGELGAAGVAGFVGAGALLLGLVAWARSRGEGVPPSVSIPRAAATLLFVGVFLATARTSVPHAIVFASAAAPYLAGLALKVSPRRASARPGLPPPEPGIPSTACARRTRASGGSRTCRSSRSTG